MNKNKIAENLKVSTRTVDRHLEKLIEKDLIKKACTKEKLEVYIFPKNENKYVVLDSSIISYILETGIPQILRVYIYLLNLGEGAIFSVQSIKKALGYSFTTKTIDKDLKEILNSLRDELLFYDEIIEMEDISGENDFHLIPVRRMKILKIINDNK